MIEFFLYWVCPSMAIAIGLRSLMQLDNMTWRDLKSWQLNLGVALTVAWPAGVLFFLFLGAEYIHHHWGKNA